VLGCERIDHGYHILEDDAVVARCRDDQPRHTSVLSVCGHDFLELGRHHPAGSPANRLIPGTADARAVDQGHQ
jgi:hypothetical protein